METEQVTDAKSSARKIVTVESLFNSYSIVGEGKYTLICSAKIGD